MTHEKTIQFQVVNAAGTVLAWFTDAEAARGWAQRHVERFPSIRVERVTVTVERELMYRPRPAKAQTQGVAA